MNGMENVGSTQAVQDPQDAIDAAHGTYVDNAANLSDQQKYPNLQLPSAAEEVPYTLSGSGSGSR